MITKCLACGTKYDPEITNNKCPKCAVSYKTNRIVELALMHMTSDYSSESNFLFQGTKEQINQFIDETETICHNLSNQIDYRRIAVSSYKYAGEIESALYNNFSVIDPSKIVIIMINLDDFHPSKRSINSFGPEEDKLFSLLLYLDTKKAGIVVFAVTTKEKKELDSGLFRPGRFALGVSQL